MGAPPGAAGRRRCANLPGVVTGPADVEGAVAAPAGPDGRRDLALAWLAGVVAALVVVAPGLAPGAWLNVDLVVTPVTPVPSGVWGLGPELPRRVPFMLPFAWLSALVPGELPVKLAVLAALASTVAGTWRLVGRWDPGSPVVARLAAGLLVGVGPFAVTRAGVGHLGLTFALALLPWALPTLLRPLDRVPATTLWCLALGACGPFGGTVALPVVAVGLLAGDATRPGRRLAGLRALALAVAAQAPWLVPTLAVAALGTRVGSAGDFTTDGGGPGGLLRLLAGHGFWLEGSQVGRGQGWEVPVAGLVLAALAVVGLRRLPAEVRRPAWALAGLGLVGAAASALPGVDRAFAWATERSVLVALREGQRLLCLYVVVVGPAAALGAAHLARRLAGWGREVVAVLPLALAVALALPGAWGAGGGLEPVTLPPGWVQVREAVRAAPGTVVVVPWRSYPLLPLDGVRRRVLNPMPIYLGGDVLASSDPGFDDGTRERSDPREPRAEVLAARLARGEDVAAELADLGVRWVVSLEVADEAGGATADLPGLRPEVTTRAITLHEVPGWAPARDASGRPVAVDRPVAPVLRTADGPVRVAAAGSGGWWRGTTAAATEDGLLVLPAGSGPALYPAALAVGLADVTAVVLAALALRTRRRAHISPGQADD